MRKIFQQTYNIMRKYFLFILCAKNIDLNNIWYIINYGDLMRYLIIYIITINLLGFLLMKLDKYYAKKGKYRIREKTFFIISGLLGSIGVYAGMYTFRHKTKHLNFTVMVPVLFILNIITVYTILKYDLLKYLM